MNIDEKLKNRRELAQIYLIITPLLVAIKQGEFPQKLFLTINQTNVTINNSIQNTDITLLYLFLLLFLIMILSFYITPYNTNYEEKKYALGIGISFSMILYFCLFDQMIKTNTEIAGCIQYLLIFTEIVIGILLYSKIKLEGETYQISLYKWEKGLGVLAFSIFSIIIDPMSSLLLGITIMMEILTTLAFVISLPIEN